MKLGVLSILFSLIATITSAYYYYAASSEIKNKNDSHAKKMNIARTSYKVMVVMISLASVYLLYLILTHKFQVSYIYQYTSKDLSFWYLISAFWAGQEGSFLLWALLIAIMGIFLIKSAGKLEINSMILLNIVQAFFLIILLKASPFELLPQSPPDGSGLNPLLQNPWMVIHPPVLFIGYAAITFPLVLTLAALLQRSYNEWVSKILPWVLFSSIMLGAGIIIGGFWAYGVLGWGGYWGWDPVENSSLIPWLTTLALLHGLLIQRRNGALQQTNISLSIFSFILVIYATFLTRSGVLADFSVHSFQDLGINSYLITFIIAVLIFSFLLFIKRREELPWVKLDFSSVNRESILVVSIFVFVASAFFILIGTSSPIITGLLGKPSQVDTTFYNKVNFPIGILMAFLLGIAPFLFWAEKSLSNILKRLNLSLLLVALSTITAYLFGVKEIKNIIFVIVSSFAFWSNFLVLVKNWRLGFLNMGAPLAHIGFGLMFVGIIISGTMDKSEKHVLTKGQLANAFDYNLKYDGITPKENGKNIANIRVFKNENNYLAQPRLYFSPYNKSWMKEPDVKPSLLSDLYISPLQIIDPKNDDKDKILNLKKGEKKEYAGYEISFSGFELINDHEQNTNMKVGANLNIRKGDYSFSIKPTLSAGANIQESEPVLFPSNNYDNNASVSLVGLSADEKSISLKFDGLKEKGETDYTSPEQLLIEISHKPFMSVLWLGTIFITLGTIVALGKRINNAI